jgi:hypothetical protein
MLLIFGTFVLVLAAVYVRGDPALAWSPEPAAASAPTADGSAMAPTWRAAAPR